MLKLTVSAPFAKGGNRLCFVHPERHDQCVKVRRPDFTLEDLRRKKGFPKNLKPLSAFDDNLEEYNVLTSFQNKYGDEAFQHISRCYGFEQSDLGKGLVLELVRDEDGCISFTIKQYLFEVGVSESFNSAFQVFCDYWERMALPSRNLLAHNVLVQRDIDGNVRRLVVIDGLGDAGIIPQRLLTKSYFSAKAKRKIADFKVRVNKYILDAEQGKKPSSIGLLLHRGQDSER